MNICLHILKLKNKQGIIFNKFIYFYQYKFLENMLLYIVLGW